MKQPLTAVVIIALILGVVFSLRAANRPAAEPTQPTATNSLLPSDPTALVSSFYQWYLSESQNPLSTKSYNDRPELSESLLENINNVVAKNSKEGFDPFLCAQDKPISIDAVNPNILDNTATVDVVETFNSGKRTLAVQLKKISSSWVIDSIACDKAKNVSGKKAVIVYFSNDSRAGESADCGLVYGVERQATANQNLYQSALTELFKGPTAAEKQQGYTSFFSSKTANLLEKLTVVDGVAYVNLNDPRQIIPNASASCGSQQFLSSIKETLMHDRQIKKVVFAINGNQPAFYDWLQIGCPNSDTQCADKLF